MAPALTAAQNTAGTGSSTATTSSVAAPNDSLSADIKDLVQLRIINDKELLTALQELSTLPAPVTSDSIFVPSSSNNAISAFASPIRRNPVQQPSLRTQIQKHQITNYKKFLADFKIVRNGLGNLESELTQLYKICDSMAKILGGSKLNSRNLIDEISKLEIERKKLVKEKDLATAYQNAFQLNSEDLKILKGTETTAEMLSTEFFDVFEKIQKIQSNVSVLMKMGHQTTAVEILDQMGLFQETALEKIYRWAQTHCKHVENPDMAEVLSKSLSYLQIRPMLLKYVLDEYCNHRRSIVVRSFIDALTGVGNIKGIELIGSTDPARYIGDMLAWIHQVIPGEKENLLTLLKRCHQNEVDEKIGTCLATILDGVCRPLNVRIEQTIVSGLDCVIMNRIYLIIQFYNITIEQVVPTSNLIITLRELLTLSHQTFITQLKLQIAAELEDYHPPGPDLASPSVTKSLLDLLKIILEGCSNASVEHIQTVMHLIINPLAMQINEVAIRLGSPDQGVYLMNSINEIIKYLKTHPNTDQLCKTLQGQIDSHLDRLSSEQSSWLVAQLGIGHIYTILHEKIDDPLSTVPGMDSASLKIFVNKLDTLISNPESVLLPQILNISDNNLRKVIQTQSFKILVAIYKQVYEAVTDPKNQYPPNLLSLEPSKLEEGLCS